jgi:hypothetical protein
MPISSPAVTIASDLSREPDPTTEAQTSAITISEKYSGEPKLSATAASGGPTIAVYAILMDAGIGFVPSLMVLVIGCALAHKDVRWLETILLSVFVTAAAVAIFSFGLGLPYPLFWWSN